MNFLIIIHMLITLALIGIILLQRSEGGGLVGLGGGASASLFSARGSANFLTRLTAILAALFMGNCLLMTIVSAYQVHHDRALIDTVKPKGK